MVRWRRKIDYQFGPPVYRRRRKFQGGVSGVRRRHRPVGGGYAVNGLKLSLFTGRFCRRTMRPSFVYFNRGRIGRFLVPSPSGGGGRCRAAGTRENANSPNPLPRGEGTKVWTLLKKGQFHPVHGIVHSHRIDPHRKRINHRHPCEGGGLEDRCSHPL